MTHNDWKLFWAIFFGTLPILVILLAMPVIFRIMMRSRRWNDRTRLGKAAKMTPEHLEQKPRELKDLEVGEESYISSAHVKLSKKERTYVSWEAPLLDRPEYDHHLPITRLKNGFSLTINPGITFTEGIVINSRYAPVVELKQAPPVVTEKVRR